eukprot:51898-Eustigmatos_ZCMA.PRE.1
MDNQASSPESSEEEKLRLSYPWRASRSYLSALACARTYSQEDSKMCIETGPCAVPPCAHSATR